MTAQLANRVKPGPRVSRGRRALPVQRVLPGLMALLVRRVLLGPEVPQGSSDHKVAPGNRGRSELLALQVARV